MTIDSRSARLVAISFVSLFLELALIRFVNSTVQVIAYFNNFLILSAFLGLGFGSLLYRRRIDLFRHFPLILCVVIALMCVLDRFGTVPDMDDHIVWTQSTSGLNLPIPLVVIAVFVANFAFFVPLGYKIGECLSAFPNPLIAYGYELLGSILGVLAFTVTSYLRMLPWVWFSVGGLMSLLLIDRNSKWILPRGLLMGVGLILVALVPSRGIWSPYYKISVIPYFQESEDKGIFAQLGWKIMVDKLRIQDALHFGPTLESTPLAPWIDYYQLPYHFRDPGKVLILGGGAGNDATFALEHGASHVDVVEIDPVIISMGFDLHPHTPYADSRVRTITDDARAYLRRTSQTYDLIIRMVCIIFCCSGIHKALL